jgi:HK97 family phage prohead protease
MTTAAAPRRASPFRIKADDVAADGTFSGYGSVFNVTDAGGDVVLPGAFAASLAEHRRRGTSVKLLWQHDPSEPIGVWLSLEEDSHGLYCRGKVSTDFDRGRQALSMLRAGALDGLSIGYECTQWEMASEVSTPPAPAPGYPSNGPGVRYLKEIALWEVSLVTFPMNHDARIDAVRGRGRLGGPAAAPGPEMAGEVAGLLAAVVKRGQALRAKVLR